MLKTYIKVRESFVRFKRSEDGASLAEYALIIALVLIGVGAALGALTTAVNGALGAGTGALNTAATPTPAPSP